MTILHFDCETLPTDDASVIAELAETIKAPGNYKKPESISEWMEENKELELAKLVSKTSFDGMYGRIACIAFAFDDEEILATLPTDSDGDAIQRFYDVLPDKNSLTFCGHNIHGFDLPFLKHRSIILGIKPPKSIMSAMNAKPWADEIADTMLMWNESKEKRVSMDKLCKALGIPGKGDFNGSMVAETWPKDPMKVIEYCRDDVARCRVIYKRITFSK